MSPWTRSRNRPSPVADEGRTSPRPSRSRSRWAVRAAWAYLAFALGFWLLLRQGDDWWPATAALYLPRWPVALPMLVLAPAALRWPRRVLIPVVAAAVVVAWPVTGAVINLPSDQRPSNSLKVMTFNAAGGKFSRPALYAVLMQEMPDVVAVQEGSPELLDPPYWGEGWHTLLGPNGLQMASRYPIHPVDTYPLDVIGGTGAAATYRVDCPLGRIVVADLHLDTPRPGLEALGRGEIGAHRKSTELRDTGSALVAQWLSSGREVQVVLGDFNLPADSSIYRRCWSRYHNAFSRAGLGWGYTKHTGWHGIRIDHVLYSPTLRCTECRVGPDVGSDHRPLIAVLTPAGPDG